MKYKKRFGYFHLKRLILIVALTYSCCLCLSSIKNAISKQVYLYLSEQVQDSAIHILKEYQEQPLVHIRRDNNQDITAVTVNGIMLSQLQIQYQKRVEDIPPRYHLRLCVSDILGSRLPSIIPGSIKMSCNIEVIWNISVVSRTIEQSEDTVHFQLVLITNGTANSFACSNINFYKELVLYETMIYNKGA